MAKPLTSTARRPRNRPARSSVRAELELLRGKELKRPGAQLMNLILTAANLRGLSMDAAATEALGLSRSYFYSLRNGGKEIAQLGEAHIAKAAKFLGMSRVSAMLAAGQLGHVDFYADPDVVRHYLLPALQFIQSDPQLAAFVPPGILDADPVMQHFVVMLYEQATGRTLIPGRISPEEIAKRHRELPQ